MAKRGRIPGNLSLDSLISELGRLDARRQEIVSQLKGALSAVTEEKLGMFRRPGPAAAELEAKSTRKRRPMSEAARKKIAEAQKARWAKVKGKAAKKAKKGKPPAVASKG